jgi:hypothetical protein
MTPTASFCCCRSISIQFWPLSFYGKRDDDPIPK